MTKEISGRLVIEESYRRVRSVQKEKREQADETAGTPPMSALCVYNQPIARAVCSAPVSLDSRQKGSHVDLGDAGSPYIVLTCQGKRTASYIHH